MLKESGLLKLDAKYIRSKLCHSMYLTQNPLDLLMKQKIHSKDKILLKNRRLFILIELPIIPPNRYSTHTTIKLILGYALARPAIGTTFRGPKNRPKNEYDIFGMKSITHQCMGGIAAFIKIPTRNSWSLLRRILKTIKLPDNL